MLAAFRARDFNDLDSFFYCGKDDHYLIRDQLVARSGIVGTRTIASIHIRIRVQNMFHGIAAYLMCLLAQDVLCAVSLQSTAGIADSIDGSRSRNECLFKHVLARRRGEHECFRINADDLDARRRLERQTSGVGHGM